MRRKDSREFPNRRDAPKAMISARFSKRGESVPVKGRPSRVLLRRVGFRPARTRRGSPWPLSSRPVRVARDGEKARPTPERESPPGGKKETGILALKKSDKIRLICRAFRSRRSDRSGRDFDRIRQNAARSHVPKGFPRVRESSRRTESNDFGAVFKAGGFASRPFRAGRDVGKASPSPEREGPLGEKEKTRVLALDESDKTRG
jgi:hypothetical protein